MKRLFAYETALLDATDKSIRDLCRFIKTGTAESYRS